MSSSRVWRLRFSADAAKAEEIADALFDAGATGVDLTPEGDELEVTLFAERKKEALALQRTILQQDPKLAVELEQISRDEWLAPWRDSLQPERISPGFVVQPTWHEAPAPAGTKVIRVEPDLVFGVGAHPSTRLAAVAVEEWCRSHAGCRVLDVGTGTGVLALVAVLSGADKALGIDVDRKAVRSARKHAKLSGVVGRARFSERPLSDVRRQFDLVVANIESPILSSLAPDLARVTRHTLVLTGLLTEQAEELERALEAHGLCARERSAQDDWARLVMQRPETIGNI